MGAAKIRKKRFLAEHPSCCFCGGSTPASTIDHVPNRACFPNREGPEGFEFPACHSCQNLFRHEEHFFAFFCRMSDTDNANYDQATSKRLIAGIKNNMPELFPNARISANLKKRTLSSFGLQKPSGVAVAEIPMAAFPREVDPVLRMVAIKIGLALYYRHKGSIASRSHLTMGYWSQLANRRTMANWEKVAQDLTGVEIGSRQNIDFGNRFGYRWAVEEDGQRDILVAISHFGRGLVACSIVADPAVFSASDRPPEWLSVAQWTERRFHDEWLEPYNN